MDGRLPQLLATQGLGIFVPKNIWNLIPCKVPHEELKTINLMKF